MHKKTRTLKLSKESLQQISNQEVVGGKSPNSILPTYCGQETCVCTAGYQWTCLLTCGALCN